MSPKSPSLWNALDEKNQLNPTGEVVALWSRFLKDRMVKASAAKPLKAFASAGHDGSFSLFVINRGRQAQKASLPKGKFQAAWSYTGKGPDDLKPSLKRLKLGAAKVTLAPVSLTIFEFASREHA